MTRLIDFLNKNSKVIFNLSVIFLCIVISLYLLLQKEDTQDQSNGILKQQFEDTLDNISQGVSDFADKFFPIRPTLRSENPLDTTNVLSPETPNIQNDSSSFDLSEFLSNPTVEKIFYKAMLSVLLTYLIIAFILRKR
jgi:predicted PurR-regulated permease PerM